MTTGLKALQEEFLIRNYKKLISIWKDLSIQGWNHLIRKEKKNKTITF